MFVIGAMCLISYKHYQMVNSLLNCPRIVLPFRIRFIEAWPHQQGALKIKAFREGAHAQPKSSVNKLWPGLALDHAESLQ